MTIDFLNYLKKRLELSNSSDLLEELNNRTDANKNDPLFTIKIEELAGIDFQDVFTRSSKNGKTDEKSLISNEVLKTLFDIDEIKEAADLNKDGKISNEEAQEALKKIAALDNDKENLSFSDIDKAISNFGINLEDKLSKITPETDTGNNPPTTNTNPPKDTNGTNPPTTPPATDLSKLTKEELNKQLEDKKTELTKAQDKYKAACNGSASEMQDFKKAQNTAYEKLQEKLEENTELKAQLDTAKGKVENLEKTVAEDEINVQNCIIAKNESHAKYDHLCSMVTQYDNSILSLEVKSRTTKDETEKKAVDAKINELKAAKEKAKTDRDNQLEIWKQSQESLSVAESTKEQHKIELEAAQLELDELLVSVEVTDEQGNDLVKAYQDAKAATKNKQNELKEAAQKEMNDMQSEISKIQGEIRTKELDEIKEPSSKQ